MKALYQGYTSEPFGADYTLDRFEFSLSHENECIGFTLSSTYDKVGRSVDETLDFDTDWPAGNGTVTLTVTMGNTSVSTKWSKKDIFQGRYHKNFAPYLLHRLLKDDLPLFEVELVIEPE